jgi:adenylate kinase
MGPPGAGKGTQAEAVSGILGVPHISTGEIFRANVVAGTPLGIEAHRYMEAGEYVPDGITNSMGRERLSHDDCRGGFLLDGYPRTVEQVGELSAMLSAAQEPLDRVIELTVDLDVVVARLVARASHEDRSDDTEEVVRRRLEVYFEQTEPLVAMYETNGLLSRVDGLGSVGDVTSRILEVLGVEH